MFSDTDDSPAGSTGDADVSPAFTYFWRIICICQRLAYLIQDFLVSTELPYLFPLERTENCLVAMSHHSFFHLSFYLSVTRLRFSGLGAVALPVSPGFLSSAA